MKKKILLLGLCGMLFITTTIFTAPTIQASAATIISAQTNVIVAPQS